MEKMKAAIICNKRNITNITEEKTSIFQGQTNQILAF